jgi:hypothetical protein
MPNICFFDEHIVYDIVYYTNMYEQHVHPYGEDFLSSSSSSSSSSAGSGVRTLSGHDRYAVAFASGGSTGRMKFVYRSEWEGDDNRQ